MRRFSSFILFCVTQTIAIQIIGQSFDHTEINISPDNHFEIAFFNVLFDEEVYLGEMALSSLPLNIGQMGGMPEAILMQMGSARLSCPCIGCSNQYSTCNGTVCKWESYVEGSFNGPPPILIPAPSLRDPLYVIFSLFAGFAASDIQVVPVHNQFVAAKITRFFDSQNSRWIDIMPRNIDLSQCSIDFTESLNPILDANAVPINVVASGFTNSERTCNYTEFAERSVELFAAIELLGTEVDPTKMQDISWSVGSILARDVWLGCTDLAQSFLVTETVNTTIQGGAMCYYDRSDPRWEEDPCCNNKLSFYQCCAPKQVTAQHTSVVGINSLLVEGTCRNREAVTLVIEEFASNVERVQACDLQMKTRGLGLDLWSSLTSFMQKCNEDIYGIGGTPPTCKTDQDCWTRCEASSGYCVVPYDNPETYLIACFAASMNQEMELYLKMMWNVTDDSQFLGVFTEHLTDDGCKGPTSWKYQGGMQQFSVTNCNNGDNNCWCDNQSGSCYQNIYVMPNMTGCLAEEACNWKNDASEMECIAKSPENFCGDCYGNQCWDRTNPSTCQVVIQQGESCGDYGLQSSDYNNQVCLVANITDVASCIPGDICPNNGDANNRWCSSSCYIPSATSQELCNLVSDAFWDTNVQNGVGFCHIYVGDRRTCLAINDTAWFPGRNYMGGFMNTKSLCDQGECSAGSNIPERECLNTYSCDTSCITCVARDYSEGTLCYRQGLTLDMCTGYYGGVYDNVTGNGLCNFAWIKDEIECENAGHFFESCSSLSIGSCRQCEEGSSDCPIVHNAVLGCKVNYWGQCKTREQCEGSGTCNDWEFQNWNNPYCMGPSASSSSNCTGVCVTSFENDIWGNPQCPYPLGWSRLGCVDLLITDPQVCRAGNATWVNRAFTRDECESHGNGCSERRFSQPTPKDHDSCLECGGTYKSMYHWTPARWESGNIKNLNWTSRKWESINTWGPTINWTKLNDVMNVAVGHMMQKAVKTQFLCKYGLLTANIEKIACDCGQETGSNCFNNMTSVQIGETTLFPGYSVINDWGSVTLEVDGNSTSNWTEPVNVTISSSSDLSFLLFRHRTGATPLGIFPNIYATVLNDYGDVVGQIVSSAHTFVFSSGSVHGALDINNGIPIDPVYTVADFGISNGTHVTAQFMNVLINTNFNPVRYTGTFTKQGTYYIIYRLADTSHHSPVTTGSVHSTTGSVHATTTESSVTAGTVQAQSSAQSQVGVLIVAGILAGSVVMVVGAAVSAMVCRRSTKLGYTEVHKD